MALTLLYVTLMVMSLFAGGHGVGLTATPIEIVPKHTKTLTLNCSHNKPETTAILKIEIRKIVDKMASQQQAQHHQQPQPQQPHLLQQRPDGMGNLLPPHQPPPQQQQYNNNQGMVGGGYSNGGVQVPRNTAQGMGGGTNAQPQPHQPPQPQQQMGGGYLKQASYSNTNYNNNNNNNNNHLGGGVGSHGANTGFSNAQFSGYNSNSMPNRQVVGSYNRQKRDVGEVFESLTRRKRRFEREIPQLRRRKRSMIYDQSHHRYTREQRSLSTATLGGGDVVHFEPSHNRFEGHGRMASPAYLTVEISSPEEGDSGHYICSITHMGSKGQIKDEFAVDVTATDTGSLEVIESRVSRLEGQLPAMSSMGQQMQKLVQEDTERSKELQKEIEKLKKENQDLVVVVEELKEKYKLISDRTTALTESQKAAAEAAIEAAKQAAAQVAQQAATAAVQAAQAEAAKAKSQQPPTAPNTPTTSSASSAGNADEKNKTKGGDDDNKDAPKNTQVTSHQNGGTAGNNNNNNMMNGQNPYQNGGGYQNSNNNNMYGGFPPQPNPAVGQWGNMPPQSPYGYNNGYYQNRGYNGYVGGGYPPQQLPPPPPHQQHQQQQQQHNQQQHPMTNGQYPPPPPQQRPPPQQGMWNGMGPGYPPPAGPQGAFGSYGNPYAYGGQANPTHLKSDDLTKITARMDQLENTRISALENDLKDVKLKWVQPMFQTLGEVEVYANVTLRAAVEQLENVDIEGLIRRVDVLETEAIPDLVYNLTVTERDVAMLRETLDIIKGGENGREKVSSQKVAELLGQVEQDEEEQGEKATEEEEKEEKEKEKEKEKEGDDDDKKVALLTITTDVPTSTLSTTTHEPTTLAMTTSDDDPRRRSCFVCGNNATLENCTPKNKDNREICKGGAGGGGGDGVEGDMMFCMTDVFENGRTREIYKRCVTEQECKQTNGTNSEMCATSSFLVPEVMECHYCCTTDDCNSSIRPDKDLYSG